MSNLDSAVESLKASRNSAAVLKMEIAKLRSSFPNLPILAYEGDDDKTVYSQWIGRTRHDFQYAMFTCTGKTGVLALRQSLQIDRTGLKDGVYFFVDRDFDDLRGQTDGDDIFLTEKYSVENYLVCPEVIESVLKVEFHCNTRPDLVCETLRSFSRDYESFLEVTKEINLRLYVARMINAEVARLPTSLSKVATVTFGEISQGSLRADEAVRFAEASDDLIESHRDTFSDLDERDRYRGKFALMFMETWLLSLAAERRKPDPNHFSSLECPSKFRLRELTLSNFASKSPLPTGLAEFIGRIPQSLAA